MARYWLQLFDPSGQALEPTTEWVCDDINAPEVAHKCCDLLRHAQVETIEIYDAPPTPGALPVQVHRRNPCKKT
ncbi:MAG: hypothetical protein ACRCY0_04435 [Synechococcus elongatus]|uniref:hypothetical protein n=1 Tax=Synechococcus elongatus TaxID=32046 RepID=UPI000039FEFF|nr:hypothetical protein [Synechococcus elongatus]